MSVGLNKILKHLEEEKERFNKAGKSGMFCDSENCLKTAFIIGLGIKELKKYSKIVSKY